MAKTISKTRKKAGSSFVPPKKKGKLSKRKERTYHTARWQTFRMFSMLYAKGHLRAKELADECGISERAAQRIMEPFKEDGILQRDEFDQGKWNFNEARHRWNKMSASGQSCAALAFMYKFSKVFGGQLRKDMVQAIDQAFMLDAEEYPYFMITPRVMSPDTALPFFQDIYDAIMSKNKLQLTYKSGSAQKSVKAWPISFIMCDGIWYLGYLLEPEGEKQEIRTLRCGNIAGVEALLGETFEKPAWVKETLQEARNIWFNRERPTRVELEVDNAIKEYFNLSEYFPRQKIISEGKDTFRVETYIDNHYEVIPNIMRFIPAIRVITPAALKKDVLDRAKEYVNGGD